MSTARQLAELYLRGSIINITIPNLTDDERLHVAAITDYVFSQKGVVKTRQMVARKLADTIGGEYREDKSAAEQETRITIWRAVVALYHHVSYTFKCKNCGTSSYRTKMGKTRTIDQLFDHCKRCMHVEVDTAGDTDLIPGSFVTKQVFQDSYAELTDKDELPTSKTPIAYIKGAAKYDNPDAIIESDLDLTKFFTEYLWGGFKQILKENERKQHNKRPSQMSDRADKIIVAELLAMLSKYKVAHNFCAKTQPEHGWFHIQVSLLQAAPEVSIELAVLLHKAYIYSIPVKLTNGRISVAETLSAPDIDALISKPEYVLVLDNYSTTTGDDDQGSYTLNSISFKTVEGVKMDLDNHILLSESSDWLDTVRSALPQGLCRTVFDFWCQRGELYQEFSEQYGDKEPRINHMAAFLGVGRKAIVEARQHIQINAFRHMSPHERKNIVLDLEENALVAV